MKKYLVQADRNLGGVEDIDFEYFDTLEEANEAATELWKHFTPQEQKHVNIQTGWVTPEMVDESLRCDDSDNWWEICGEWDADNNCVEFGK